jgi:hypothetical protein
LVITVNFFVQKTVWWRVTGGLREIKNQLNRKEKKSHERNQFFWRKLKKMFLEIESFLLLNVTFAFLIERKSKTKLLHVSIKVMKIGISCVSHQFLQKLSKYFWA